MASKKGRAGIVDGQVIATINDKFGEPRRIVQRGSRIRVASNDATVVIAMNREVAVMVGARIREARMARGWTLEQLALRVGMSSGWPKNRMYEIESGPRKQGIRFGTLYAIAAALNVEVASLLPPVADVLATADVKAVTHKVVTLAANGRVVA